LRFLADENFPGTAVAALRLRGHDVVWVREARPGCQDQDVLAWAQAETRLLLTFDKDFGELAFRFGLPASVGVVLFRLPPSSPRHVAEIAVAALDSRDDWTSHFSVIEEHRIRMTRLP
jgi:predicted nuclease of predicted toxin-antitoxin system